MNIRKRPAQLLSLVSVIFFSACTANRQETAPATTDLAVSVTVATPSNNNQHEIQVSGQIEASQTAIISTRVMGNISALKVKVGDHVVKGQLLATISNQDILAKRGQIDAMIAEATVAVSNAQKDLDRYTTLYQQQSATAKELDNVTLQYNTTKARLDGAKLMRAEINATLAYTNLEAPFAGIITQKLADAGTMASPGMPILTLVQSGSYQVAASVPEFNIVQIREGAIVDVDVNSIHKMIKGKIVQISPSSQFTGGQYTVKINIPDSDKQGLFAGMYTHVSIPVNPNLLDSTAENKVLVLLGSIEHKDQLTGLYTVGSNNMALLRWVRLGKTYGNYVEVLSGLGRNEQYVTNADGKLYNGIAIKVKN